MTEFEKMRNGEFYDFYSQECLDSYIKGTAGLVPE